jgi:hypothetical protein
MLSCSNAPLSDIETSVAVRSETDPRDPESAAGWTSKRAVQQTRSDEESSTWSAIGRAQAVSSSRAPLYCKTVKFELSHSCFVERIS